MQRYFANENVKSKIIKIWEILTIFNFAYLLWLEIQHFEKKKKYYEKHRNQKNEQRTKIESLDHDHKHLQTTYDL